MTEQRNDYQTSSAFSEFIAFIGWVSIIAAGISGYVVYQEAGSFGLIAIPICIAVALVGLLLVVAGQALRAMLDTANYTRKMLELQRSGGS